MYLGPMAKGKPLDSYLAWCIDRACLVAGRAAEHRARLEYERDHPEERTRYMGSGRNHRPRQALAPRPESGVEYNVRKQTLSGELPFIGKQR
jgi:hypothetical protein